MFLLCHYGVLGVELPLSRSGTLTRELIINPAMPYDEPSNRQSVNTGLRLNRTTPAPTLIGCGMACKLPDCKGKHSHELPSDMSLPHELNNIYAHFEASITETCMRASTVPDEYVITLSIADARKIIKTGQHSQGQTDYQAVYSEHALTKWQVSSLTFSTCP